jgi:hypothetical protein
MTGLLLALLFLVLSSEAAVTQANPKAPQPASPSTAKSGSARDPADDTHFYFGDVLPPDLKSANVDLTPGTGMSLTARFVAGSFSPTTTAVHFTFFVQPPTEPSSCGDYLVNFNVAGAPKGEVTVRRRTQGTEYQDVGKGTVKVVTDGVELAVPEKVFGEGLWRLTHWHVVVAIRLRENAESRILDYLPDTDLPAATLEESRGRRTRR